MIGDDVPHGGDLRSRADGIVSELARITQAWREGRAPSQAELYALADDLGALRGALTSGPLPADGLLS